MKKGFLYIVFSLICASQIAAQPRIKDSLQNVLKLAIGNPTRVEILNQLAYQYYDFNDTIASNYANEALILAKQIGYEKGLKYAYTMVGLGYSSQSKFKEAIDYFTISDKLNVPSEDGTAAYNLSLLGNCYRDMANYDSALAIYGRAIALYKIDKHAELSTIYKNIARVYLFLWKNKDGIAMADSATMYLERDSDADQYVQMDLWSIYGQAYKNMLRFDLSQMYYDKMCNVSTNLDDYYHQIMCQQNKAELEYEKGNFSAALALNFKALELTNNYLYPPQYVNVLIQIGETYSELAQYDVASQYFHKALLITEKLGLRAETALIFSELAWIEKDLLHFEKALNYCNQSLELRTIIGDKKGISNCYNIYSLIFLLKKDYARSIEEQEKALKIREELAYVEGISASIFNLSLVFEELNQFQKAIDYQRRAIKVEEKTNNKQSLAISYNSLSRLLIKTGQLKEAFTYLTMATVLSERTGSFLLRKNNAIEFISYYEKVKDYKKALEYAKLAKQWNDSIYSEKSITRLIESEALYKVEKREKDIELLKQIKETQAGQLKLQESELSQKNWIIAFSLIGIILFSIAGIFGFQLYRNKEKANIKLKESQEEIQAQSEELTEANQQIALINKSLEEKVDTRTSELRQAYKELDTFFYRSSHDFRRPITTFLGLAGVAKITVKDTSALELFEKVAETAMSLDKMLQKLQSISDVGANQMVFKEVFFEEQINEIADSFDALLHQKSIALTKVVNAANPFVSYPAMVKIIIENIFENAVYFSGTDNPLINIKASVYPEVAIIEIEDNGQGIQDEYKSRIFEMYFRANERSKGNGLGLYIAKKAVEKLDGKIRFTSQHHVGTLFTIEIPNQI